VKRELSEAEIALGRRVRDALTDEWREARLLCPKGHYIANVTVGVPVVPRRDEAPLWIWPRASNGVINGDPSAPEFYRHGMRIAWDYEAQSTNVVLGCRNSKCNYRGVRDMFVLAVEVGAAALAGNREHTLTA
jgi:hypothetical protein